MFQKDLLLVQAGPVPRPQTFPQGIAAVTWARRRPRSLFGLQLGELVSLAPCRPTGSGTRTPAMLWIGAPRFTS